MASSERPLTTELLNRFAAGDRGLEDEVVARIHRELRALAEAQIARQGRGSSLQPTALVHEAWLRLVGREDLGFPGRGHFFRFAAKLMRNLLIDRARAARREPGLSVSGLALAGDGEAAAIQALDLEQALARLEAREAGLARVVELRLFCGLSHAEVAAVLDCSERTAERRWRFARAWLVGELAGGRDADSVRRP